MRQQNSELSKGDQHDDANEVAKVLNEMVNEVVKAASGGDDAVTEIIRVDENEPLYPGLLES